jgi:hypothetical protein
MSKTFNSIHAVFGRTLRLSLRIHTSEMVCTLAGLGLMILVPALRAQSLPIVSSTSHDTRGVTQPVLTAPATQSQEPVQQQSPAPYTEKQAPNKPPQVSYEAGQLTIVAENSKLSDVLSALRASMGADIDLPASASAERIWARLGPGPARKILATLLSATKLDYVIQASDSDPDGIRNVWLTARTTGPAATSARAGTTPTAHPLPPRQSDIERSVSLPNHSVAPEDRAPEETVTPEPAVATDMTPAIPQPAQTDPGVVPTSATPAPAEVAAAADIQASEPNKPAANPTDQMIHTLQNMYEQRKQLQLARTPSAAN